MHQFVHAVNLLGLPLFDLFLVLLSQGNKKAVKDVYLMVPKRATQSTRTLVERPLVKYLREGRSIGQRVAFVIYDWTDHPVFVPPVETDGAAPEAPGPVEELARFGLYPPVAPAPAIIVELIVLRFKAWRFCA